MTLEIISLNPDDLQKPKSLTLSDLQKPNPHCRSKKTELKLFLECLNDVLILSQESVSALSDKQLDLVEDEVWFLYSTLKVKKSYFESLDLPEYHDDYEQLSRIIRKMVIAKRFAKLIDREKYFRLVKKYGLLSREYTDRYQFKVHMESIRFELASLVSPGNNFSSVFQEMCQYMLDNYGDDGLDKILTQSIHRSIHGKGLTK